MRADCGAVPSPLENERQAAGTVPGSPPRLAAVEAKAGGREADSAEPRRVDPRVRGGSAQEPACAGGSLASTSRAISDAAFEKRLYIALYVVLLISSCGDMFNAYETPSTGPDA